MLVTSHFNKKNESAQNDHQGYLVHDELDTMCVFKDFTIPLRLTSRCIHSRFKCSNVWQAGYHRAIIAHLLAHSYLDPAGQRKAGDDDVMT